MSDLERHLLALASRELGRSAPASTADAIGEAINDHHLWEANHWLIPLLRRLLDREPTTAPVEIPRGYPAGENGLANLLADLHAEAWIDVDDYGEGVFWRLPVAGLKVFISRESASSVRNVHTYEVRRAVR
jgi:hypothetical protein